jgi:hypothetical protein
MVRGKMLQYVLCLVTVCCVVILRFFILGKFALAVTFSLVRQSSGNVTSSLSYSLGTQSVCESLHKQSKNLLLLTSKFLTSNRDTICVRFFPWTGW